MDRHDAMNVPRIGHGLVGTTADAARRRCVANGRWLAAGLGSGGIRIYDREADWAEAARDTEYGDSVYGVAFAPDDRLATTSLDGRVRLYDARFRRIAQQEMALGSRPSGVGFHPDGDRLAVGFEDASMIVLGPHPVRPGHLRGPRYR